MKVSKALRLSCLCGWVLLSGCVTQDEMGLLKSRIDLLEQRIEKTENRSDQLGSRIDEGFKSQDEKTEGLRTQSAELYATMDQIREEMRTLRGKVEETDHYLRQQKGAGPEVQGVEKQNRLETLEAVSLQNQQRVDRIEQYLNLEPSGKTEKSKVTAAAEPAEAESEQGLYQAAKKAFDAGDLDGARQRFGAFLAKYPKSSIADSAQFWIGETYYREKWYEKAILEYQKVIENYPKGNKLQGALLKQGFAFLNLGDKANSKLILMELVRKYPNSSEATIARQKLKEIQ